MELLTRFVKKTEFESYEDFKANFRLDVPGKFEFARDVVDAWAELEPEKRALVYCNDEGVARTFTFSDISVLSKKAATYFTQMGIHRGDKVLTLLRRRYEYWICAVALHRIGAVLIPASIQLRAKDIDYRLNQADAKCVIAVKDDFVCQQVASLRTKCLVIFAGDEPVEGYPYFNAEYENCALYEEPDEGTNADQMLLYFTSGTTGYPKMAVHNRTYPLGHIMTAKYMQCVQNNGLHLTQSDSGWAKFGWGNIYGQWICGSAILGYDPIRFDPEQLMEHMKEFKPTSLCIPPTMYRFLLKAGVQREHLASIKWFATAGEPLSGEVNSAFYDLCGHYIHEGYGQSEGTPITCSFQWLGIRPSSMGRPSPLYDVALIDKDGNRCAVGDEGEVVMFVKDGKQVGLLDYYYQDGEKINPIENGIYHTGDIAYEDEDGYYWYVGRNDDMIKCSGYRIGPFEIESVLNTHEAVKECAIVGRPDEIRGQIVCAVVVLAPGFEPSDALTKELQDYVKKLTAPYKYPRKIEYVSELPKTTSGKITRNALRTNK